MGSERAGTWIDGTILWVNSGISRLLTVLAMLLALRLVSGNVDHDAAVSPIDLPIEVVDEVYQGDERKSDELGRAIAFVRGGRLFVVDRDVDVVFALEPAQGDTPPLVMAIARDLAPELIRTQPATVVLANLELDDER